MKHKPPPFLIVLVIIAAIAGGGYWYFSNNPEAWQQAMVDFGLATDVEAETRLTASGFVEANEINISAELSGRIEAMTIDQGDPILSAQTLIQLDTALLEAQREQIEAQIALAEAQLAQLRAGTPQEQIAVAEAAVALTRAESEAANQAWQDAIMLRDNPQQLNAQIDANYMQLNVIKLQQEQMGLIRDAVELRESLAAHIWDEIQRGFDWSVTFPKPGGGIGKKSGHYDFPEGDKQQSSVEWNLATMDVWEAWVNLERSNVAYETTQSELYTLLSIKEEPLQAQLQITQTQTEYQTKLAAIEVAQANLEQIKAGPPESQISVLEANREQARSRLATLEAQYEKYTLVSPIDGLVVERIAHRGEIAVAGATLLTVADLDKVTLTVFVPALDYGRLGENQTVEIYVDSYPNETFEGTITYISDEAEFTPKNVQTQEERVSLVYAIKITLPNAENKLKPGMPADAVFIEARPR
jgi:multidrug efflux pump subunit AcrA (membrane-fusion protein)